MKLSVEKKYFKKIMAIYNKTPAKVIPKGEQLNVFLHDQQQLKDI